MSITLIFKNKERLPYGNKDRGQFIPAEKGRHAIFVPSFGAMEKEEIDDIVLAAQEKEDTRLKKKEKSPTKQNLENLTLAAMQASRGKRAKTIKQILKEV